MIFSFHHLILLTFLKNNPLEVSATTSTVGTIANTLKNYYLLLLLFLLSALHQFKA